MVNSIRHAMICSLPLLFRSLSGNDPRWKVDVVRIGAIKGDCPLKEDPDPDSALGLGLGPGLQSVNLSFPPSTTIRPISSSPVKVYMQLHI